MIGLVAVTAAGRAAAARLVAAWPGRTRLYDGPAATALPDAFGDADAVVVFLAVGATVRLLAPLLRDKRQDAGVVCVDEALRFAVPVAGAHAGGANDLARRVAAVLGAEPVITTASDAAGAVALDGFGADLGFVIEPGSDLAAVGTAVLSGQRVTLSTDTTWPLPPLPPAVVARPARARCARDHRDRPHRAGPRRAHGHLPSAVPGRRPRVQPRRPARGGRCPHRPGPGHRPPVPVLGPHRRHRGPQARRARPAGRGRPTRLVPRHVPGDRAGRSQRPEPQRDGPRRRRHPQRRRGRRPPRRQRPKSQSIPANPTGPNPSRPTVPATLVVPKQTSPHATAAIARRTPRGRLAIVGIGPGARDLLTPRAAAELRRARIVVGLDQYLNQVADLLRPGTILRSSGLGQEQERAAAAVADAAAGHAVALIGSGDAGIYAMGSPALEFADATIDVIGVPGVTAALAAAAALGAPLGHDHAMISLSDLHTPWEVIERRVSAAADADLVVCFYNPASRERDWQLRKALAILAAQRPPGTPVGWVRDATRPGQSTGLATLATFDPAVIDMRTMVIVGSSRTRRFAGRMVTPREYRWGSTREET